MPFIFNGLEVIHIGTSQHQEDKKTARLVMMGREKVVLIDPILSKYQIWVKTFLCHMNTPQYGIQLTAYGQARPKENVKSLIVIWQFITRILVFITAMKAVARNHTHSQKKK